MTLFEHDVVELSARRDRVHGRGSSSRVDDARRHIRRIAARRFWAFGAVSLSDLVASAEARGIEVSTAEARRLIFRAAEFAEDEWFGLPDGRRSRLTILSRRMMSVNSPLDVAVLQAGMCRACTARDRALVPPVSVVAEIYRRHGAFEIDRGLRVRPLRRLDYRVELQASERLFVDVLRSSWIGVLDDTSFRGACVAAGMSGRAFDLCAPRSSVLDQARGRIWFLRGTRVSSITAAALRSAKEAPSFDEWLEDGE